MQLTSICGRHAMLSRFTIKVNHQQLRSVGLRPIQKIPNPIKWRTPLPEVINQIRKKHSSENSYDKKTSNELSTNLQK